MKQGGYIGSVRFFKNMILLALIICIAVPTGLSIHYRGQLNEAEQALNEAAKAGTGRDIPNLDFMRDGQGGVLHFEVPAYQELYPDFYAPSHVPAERHTDKTVFLTFDDGPSEQTAEILEILEQEDVKATFFVVGGEDPSSMQWLKDIADQGHTIGMHSYSQDYKVIYSSVEAFLEDMYQVFTQIREATGEAPTVFRFPGGSINAYNYGIYQELMAEMLRRGFIPCDWNLSGGDETAVSAQDILDSVLLDVDRINRGFILLHDGADKETTVEALGPMIQQLKEKGFAFERLTPETKPILFGYRK